MTKTYFAVTGESQRNIPHAIIITHKHCDIMRMELLLNADSFLPFVRIFEYSITSVTTDGGAPCYQTCSGLSTLHGIIKFSRISISDHLSLKREQMTQAALSVHGCVSAQTLTPCSPAISFHTIVRIVECVYCSTEVIQLILDD